MTTNNGQASGNQKHNKPKAGITDNTGAVNAVNIADVVHDFVLVYGKNQKFKTQVKN